jgi:hypothetical protein
MTETIGNLAKGITDRLQNIGFGEAAITTGDGSVPAEYQRHQ